METHNPVIKNKEFEELINSRWPDHLYIYTDGSPINTSYFKKFKLVNESPIDMNLPIYIGKLRT